MTEAEFSRTAAAVAATIDDWHVRQEFLAAARRNENNGRLLEGMPAKYAEWMRAGSAPQMSVVPDEQA